MFRLYWGDTHDNTYQAPDPDFSMDERLAAAAAHLDFYCGAYYPSTSPAFRKGGHPSEDTSRQPLNVETWKLPAQIDAEWREVKEAIRRCHRDGSFVAFPGFEWQGDGSWGDHNVFFNEDDPPLFRVETLKDLYRELRGHRALAIPHHTAYIRGFRGKDWDIQDDTLSPFAEVYSVHGSSEGESFGGALRNNPFLGPEASDGSYTAAVSSGRRVGIIGSTDNWGPMPGHYGWGLAGVWAESLTRESLWDAFVGRRVYGVSGDRIRLEVTLDGAPMGSVVPRAKKPPVFRVQAEALDRIDYVDFVRDESLIDRVSIVGESEPGVDLSEEFLLRLEYGWGPATNVLDLPPKRWAGTVRVEDGEITRVEPCWIEPGQEYSLETGTFSFTGTSSQETVSQPAQNGYVLALGGKKTATVEVEIDGVRTRATLAEMCRGGRVLWNRAGSAALIARDFETDAEVLARKDVLFGMAYKAKVHAALPVAVYRKDIAFTDRLYDGKPHSYRIRLRQKNGHLAWSSPIWVE